MNWAAGNGHLHVVKWLHEHRTEGCTTDAMDWAAENGHLDIVKWLHEHRIEGCTTNAMDKRSRKWSPRYCKMVILSIVPKDVVHGHSVMQ